MRLDAGPSRLARVVAGAARAQRGPRTRARVYAPSAARQLSSACTVAPVPPPMATSASIPHAHGAFEHLSAQLSGTQPCFGTQGDKVELLTTPTEFHDRLLEMVKRARRRVLISTLYIGTEEASLVDAVSTALATRPGLRATFVLDYNRATRPGKGTPQSTVHMLTPLLEKYGDRVDVLLYRSPKLKGVLEKIVPPRFNEGWGTWHAKIYAVDDDVVLSGANLAASYFTNRQDRYVYIASHPSLLSYLFSITRLISDYTYRVTAHARPGMLGPHGVPLGASTGGSDAAALWKENSLDPRGFQSHAQATLRAFQQAWRASNIVRTRDAAAAGADTWFWPVVQAGVLGLREEERAMGMVWDAVRESGGEDVKADLTSGYFGLYKAYKRAVIDSPASVDLLAASPKANGFYGSKGFSRLIPEGYTLLERRFHASVVREGREWDGHRGVRLQEWERDGWTYHAKGMWLSPVHGANTSPFFTFIGSSNLSTRSLNLDTELSLLLSTSSPALREQLAQELARLQEYAHDVGAETWKLPERRVSLLAKILVALGVEGML